MLRAAIRHACGLAIALLLWGCAATAQTIRIATYDPGLTRKGPGLLLRDIRKNDPQVLAAAQVIAAAAPDAILLTGIDWDLDGKSVRAFAVKLAEDVESVSLPVLRESPVLTDERCTEYEPRIAAE